MAAIPYQKKLLGLDMDRVCRNWEANNADTLVPMACKAEALKMLVNAVNNLWATYAPMQWCHAWPTAANGSYPSASNPYIPMSLLDNADNCRVRQYSVIGLTPNVGDMTDGMSFQRTVWNGAAWNLDSNTLSAPYTATGTNAVTVPYGTFAETLTYNRGTRIGIDTEEGLSTHNGYIALDIASLSAAPSELDSARHSFCAGGSVAAGQDILENVITEVHENIQAMRALGQTVGCWSAYAESGSFTGTDPGDGNINSKGNGIWCSTTTPTNIFDAASTARTATSPGISIHAQYAGTGPISQEAGRKIGVLCRVFAQCSTNAGTLTFEGPSSITGGNTCSITVAGGLDWYGSTDGSGGNIVYLDSNSPDSSANDARNKIDIFASVGVSTADLKIFAVHLRKA